MKIRRCRGIAAVTLTATCALSVGTVHAAVRAPYVGNGVLTFYEDANLSACGTQIDAQTGRFATVPKAYWTAANHTKDPLCAKGVKVSYKGKVAVLPIGDMCPGCAANQLDLSRPAFAIFADPATVSRITDASWEIVNL